MATEVLLPQLGLTMNEGIIFEWAVEEGDSVEKLRSRLSARAVY